MRKQAGEELRTICGGLHQRLIKQMLKHVLTADVDDEGNFRPECRDVREVLFGPYADEFGLWLKDQSLPVLRAIIRQHDLDATRRIALEGFRKTDCIYHGPASFQCSTWRGVSDESPIGSHDE